MKALLSERNELLICNAMKSIGFESAEDVHGYILESLYIDEVDEILDFLNWLHKSGLPFGRANSQLRWIAFKERNSVHTPTTEQLEIINGGNYLKTSYGIAKIFEWRLYSYKGKRYNVSMFNNEIEQVNKIYCTVCGRGTYNIKIVFGLHTCPTCAKEING